MLNGLGALQVAAEVGPYGGLPSPLRHFIAELRRHEAAERHLLEAFLLGDWRMTED